MFNVAAFLNLLVASSLSKAGVAIWPDDRRTSSLKKLRAGMQLFAATTALLVMTACGGGWNGYSGAPPTITKQPVNQTVNVGQTATFSVTATGSGTLTYQWFLNGTAISGATSSTYTTPATASTDSGSVFTVTVTNASGSVTSSPATLTVTVSSTTVPPSAPLIISQPANQTVQVGQTATFSVTANGTAPLTYQWFKNGTLIPGATSSSYTTPATVIGDNNSQFTVTVTNATGAATSNPATLTVVNTTPVATSLACNSSTPPYNSSATLVPIFSGGTAVIGSTGVGSSDITLSAVSGSSYSTPLLISAKTYTLSVTGTGGAVASTTCTVTPMSVTISPISPANATIAPGTQTFTATASGGTTNTLMWTASAGTFIGNVWTSPTTIGTYTITATSVDEPSVAVTTTVTLSLPVITGQPLNVNVCNGATTTLSVTALYASTYQWFFNGSPIAGATSSSYFIPSTVAMDVGNYTVTVTNAAGSVTSKPAKVVVGSSITSNPVSLSIVQGQTATFSVAATGDAPFSYQWNVIAAGSSTGTAVTGATSSVYTTPVETTSSSGEQFYATVTDNCGSVLTSTSAMLTVNTGNDPPTITMQPVGQTVAIGGTATFTVTAVGSPTLTYQWYRIPAGSVTGTAVSGATATTYTVPSSATTISNDQDGYYVIVSNPYGQALSQTATLAVGSGILITKQPMDVYVSAGDPATFSVTATSALPLTYQWFEAAPGSSHFTAIPGATSTSYTQATTAVSDSGSVFYVVVSNGSSTSVTSHSASLFVGSLTGIGNLCEGWQSLGDALPPAPDCSIQLSAATLGQRGEIVWPNLISTGDLQLSFTLTTSNSSTPPADGFAMTLGDPSLGASLTSIGNPGGGLGAEGIPGVVLAFDDYHDPGDPAVPYLGVGRGETALWENPYFNVNSNIPPLAAAGATVTHTYVVSLAQGVMTVTMDGVQVFSGNVTVPPVAYLYFSASTGALDEQTVISNLSSTITAPSN
ncbi:immunoglobulin domain-containing protein [Granulicella sp. S190]|uniref:immunoglobulin domain-containing protein n=1 Tax=Granulicella sp. S190 TaxID=1747226 RepID=UPI00131BC412|nr:immunoglobulin domain-containing protein [Granulicella sp. S190]